MVIPFRCGFYSLAGNVESSEQDYEILWRLGNWNITQNDPKQREFDGQNYRENNFEFYHYHALRSIKRMEEQNAKFAAKSARNVVIEILKLVSSECAQNIYKYITWLQMIQQIDDFCLVSLFCILTVSNSFSLFDKNLNLYVESMRICNGSI